MTDENLEFFPGTVIPSKDGKWTFTVRDQFERIWNAEENFSMTFVFEKATEAKATMRRFCGIGVIN